MKLTDSILMLMFGGGIGSPYLLFCGPILKSGGFEFSTSITVYAGNCIGCELSAIISYKMC